MDNASRSEHTRKTVIAAALAIVARDGVARLTLDAIVRESGVSKGGLLHQFRSKDAVLKALLQHQMAEIDAFSRRWREQSAAGRACPELAVEIAKYQHMMTQHSAVALAISVAVAQDPTLMEGPRESGRADLARVRAEAADPDLATLRWAAARGLALSAVFGILPFSQEETRRLFARLADDRQWRGCAGPDE